MIWKPAWNVDTENVNVFMCVCVWGGVGWGGNCTVC